MKGDIIVVEEYHKKSAKEIVPLLLKEIQTCKTKYIITVSGESGSGKSETALAIKNELDNYKIKAIILGQDDYFYLPPKTNAQKRKQDPKWLGPHIEVNFPKLEENIISAVNNEESIQKPLVDYDNDQISKITIKLKDIDTIIVEGTYTALLKDAHKKIFISKNKMDTYEHRKKRNRGDEMGDSFLENILEIEHKIIAGHQYLADYIITKDNELIIK